MSLNGRIAMVAVAALLAAPLWLPLSPFGWLWWRRQRRLARAQQLVALNAVQARAITAFAEATLPEPPEGGWATVAQNVDAYLANVDSPRHWRSLAVLTSLEFAPLLRLRAPMSRLPLERRRAFVERHLSTTRGLLAVPALARQLVRMGYYTAPDVAEKLGFRTMRARRNGPLAAVHAAAAARKAVG